MNDEKEKLTRKRQYEDEDEDNDNIKRKERVEQYEIRFDFNSSDDNIENEDITCLCKKLIPIKEQLNYVKSSLSDQDIAEWNKLEYINK